MAKFIQLTDINGTDRFINTKHIVFIERINGDQCRISIDLPGRGEYNSYAFLSKQTYDEAMRLIIDAD